MSDDQQNQSAEQQPNAGAAQDGGNINTDAPYAVFPTADAFNQRIERAARSRMNKLAKEAGFESWDAMQERLNQEMQNTASAPGESTTEPEPPNQDVAEPTPAKPELGEAERLRMALRIGAEKNLPPALISRLQGDTLEEMAADADQLLSVVATRAGPGVPGVRNAQKPVTFTRAQLQNPAFVREHADEIRQAAAEGRIVDS